MRTAMLLSLLLSAAIAASAQTRAPAPKPAAATGTQKPRATPAAAGRSGIAIVVTDPKGATLTEVNVSLDGPTTRSSATNASGQLNFSQLQAGTYRLRFSGDEVITFEKEVTLRAGQTLSIDVTLNEAPPPKEIVTEAPAPPAAAPVGPVGMPQVLSLVDLVESEIERKQPRRESLVSCSGSTRSTLLQLNQDQPDRLYENAEALLYVIAGEGILEMSGRETRLSAGSFASVPRNTTFGLGRRGRNPLILLSVLSGEPCEEAK